MRTFTRTLTVAGSVAAAIAVGGLASAHAAGTTLSKGHVDVLDVEYDGVALDLHVHDESVTPDVEYRPADVVLQALPASAYTVPTGSCYTHLGTAGSTVLRLPQVQNANLLWPGLSGEHLASGVFQNNKVQVKLVSVSGPGRITVYKDGLCPKSNRYYDSGDATLTNVKDITAGEHDHANWVFTKAGTYIATFQVSGPLTNGTKVGPASATYTFKAGS
ncbi:choice-of-anchor M domain-containing protein [Streptomyces sp. NPDC056308]|uniref:choice-of-anchor M domain-containing protein n=1 Tax=Streptomyces sp. NPDC056308 TaxID=3345780 RepID=UPI0035DDD2D5